MSKSVAICLFRNDLRLHDNPMLSNALKSSNATHILPVFIFDPVFFDISSVSEVYKPPVTWHHEFPRNSVYRSKFLVESVLNLRKNLAKIGSNLLIQFGDPSDTVDAIFNRLTTENIKITGLYYSKEFTFEEKQVERALQERFKSRMPLFEFNSATLIHPDDLPFSIQDLPDVYTHFRTKVESYRESIVKDPIPTVESMKPYPLIENLTTRELSDVELFSQMKLANSDLDNRSAFPFSGGETTGLKRIKDYFWGTHAVKTYKQTRNGMIGDRYSTKFSPWLSNGCISPRTVISMLSAYEKEYGASKDTYWVWFELLWREYFKFVGLKFGTLLFNKSGLLNKSVPQWTRKQSLVEAWINGKTGVPFVDANMRELRRTGFMSNRGRQNVASFFVKDLKLDWTIGAEWFESQLLDHDPCSNYGNWLYTAGLGNDPREDRHFNMIKQAKDYDPQGEYVKLWCPELSNIPASLVHVPWKMSGEEQVSYKCAHSDYPIPIIMVRSWEAHASRTAGADEKTDGNPAERVFEKKKMSKNRLATLEQNQSRSKGGGWTKK